MQIQNTWLGSFVKHLALGATSACIALSYALPSLAVDAVLHAVDSDSRINIRSGPTTDSRAPHYGLSGDNVDALYETQGADGYTWYYVRFYQSGAEGWVRGDLIRFPNASTSEQAYCDTYQVGSTWDYLCNPNSAWRSELNNINFSQPGS